MLFFFFSSRRRHTRCGRDWSSDVCSSDLEPATFAALKAGLEAGRVSLIGGEASEERLPLLSHESILAELKRGLDRKSTRLNSSHVRISYAVFCLKKKNEACSCSPDYDAAA